MFCSGVDARKDTFLPGVVKVDCVRVASVFLGGLGELLAVTFISGVV